MKNDNSKLIRDFGRRVQRIKGLNLEGLAAGGMLIKERSMLRVPVDEGVLKSSHYLSHNGNLDNPVVEIGATAEYAVYVHEDLNARHTVGEAKFLENAVLESRAEVLQIIIDKTRVP